MKKTLILDNYDSFTYNLYQYLAELGGNPVVHRNDALTLEQIRELAPTHIVISPGPGNPSREADFGVCGAVIERLSPEIPLLGVCLGHQGIVDRLGGKVVRAPQIMHGKTSKMTRAHFSSETFSHPDILADLPETFEAMRYHSLMADPETMPAELKVTATTQEDGLIMALQHVSLPLYGIQFHPESIGTPLGKIILTAFLNV